MSRPAAPKVETPGVVVADAVYTLAEIRQRLGLGDWAFRQARRRGLRVMRFGRRGYIRGSDAIQFLAQAADRDGCVTP